MDYANPTAIKGLTTDIDGVIHEALALVNLTNLYPINATDSPAAARNSSTISDLQIIFYKAMFLTLRNCTSQYVKKRITLPQDTSLEEGWARLPSDYLAQDPSTAIPLVIRTDPTYGRIVNASDSEISYIFIPVYLRDLPYTILHYIQATFLALCTGRDDTFERKAPIIRELQQDAKSLMHSEMHGESGRNHRAGNYNASY